MSGEKASSFKRDQVVHIINSVISKVKSSEEISRESIFRELNALKSVIDDLRKQLSSMDTSIISQTHIPSATDELDAVVQMTEQATGTIMDSCEVIQSLMAKENEGLKQKIEEQTTKIFEACTFQDITGQRITKVVKTLKVIDDKVSGLLSALEGQFPAPEGRSPAANTREIPAPAAVPAESLLNGPQLPQKAVSQEDIDKLLAEFDN